MPVFKVPWLVPTGSTGQTQALFAAATDPSSNRAETSPVQLELGMRPSELLTPLPGQGEETRSLALRPDGLGLATHGPYIRLFRIQETGSLLLGSLPLGEREAAVAATFVGSLALVAIESTAGQTAPTAEPTRVVVIDVANTSIPIRRARSTCRT
jgi:hypothetical protein